MPIEYTLWHSIRSVSMWVLLGPKNMQHRYLNRVYEGFTGVPQVLKVQGMRVHELI